MTFKTKNSLIIFLQILFLFTTYNFYAQVLPPKGLWKFDDPNNLIKATVGNNLELVGNHTFVAGPTIGNGAVKIGRGSYYKLIHGISMNGSGNMVNEYSIQIDFKIPDLIYWRSFFQTSPNNNNDGDCFIDPNGNIGVQATGYSTFKIKPNEWYRLVISVKNGTQYKYYIDGQLILNGFFQAIDGRFALDKILLMFADDNGEDGEIDCAEISIWNYPLSSSEVKSLGGYGHASKQLVLVPYLQSPTPSSIFICWHDSLTTETKVEYGTTQSLGNSESGSFEIVADEYVWHSVKLTGLNPNTKYFYKISSGSGSSNIYSFKTLPLENYNGKITLLLLSDTHSPDTAATVKVIKAAKRKLQDLYGDNFQNFVNLILHSGDLVVTGSEITHWTDQYFAPMSHLSPYIGTITVPGNHEAEGNIYYSYMKYDDISAFPSTDQLSERFWSFKIGNTFIIGLNSNLTNSKRTHQTSWLDEKLKQIEADPTIDFVLLIVHHLPISELWGEGISDAGSLYVKNQIIPILKKYSKVVQLSYGHTHGYERGTVESNEEKGDFRLLCGGGGGGPLDYWGSFKNSDFNQIHISYDHYGYQIIEIDVSNKTFEGSFYTLGNSIKKRDNELLDKWYRNLNQPKPSAPQVFSPIFSKDAIIFNTSPIDQDSIMSIRIQVADNISFAKTIIDTLIHWKNIFGVDGNFNPVDLNKGINLTKAFISNATFVNEKIYYYRARYRDHNLSWSAWSNINEFQLPPHIDDNTIVSSYDLKQNYPNPFNAATKIIYQIPVSGFVTLKVFDLLGKEISTLVNTEKKAGKYEAFFDGSFLSSGVYFYQLQVGDFKQIKKLILLR